MHAKLSSALIAAALIAGTSDAASATSALAPTQYRAELNAVCRITTVAMHQIEAKLAAARAAGNVRAYAVDLGIYLGLGLREDAAIERTPIPPALRQDMTSVTSLLKRVDTRVRAGLVSMQGGNPAMLQTALAEASSLTSTINLGLDRAGLRDCGTNQS